MYSKTISTVTPQFKPFISTNYLPEFSDDSCYATFRRVRIVPFTRTYVDEENFDSTNPNHRIKDETLEDRVKDLVNQFNMMWVYYYKIYVKEGLRPTEKIREETRKYLTLLDGVKMFLGENLEKHDGGKAWVNDLYTMYKSEFADDGVPMKKREFMAKLEREYEVKRETARREGRRNEYYVVDHRFVGDYQLIDEYE